ncbi:MAG: DUF6666 family protein [Planctomycetota bacterium]
MITRLNGFRQNGFLSPLVIEEASGSQLRSARLASAVFALVFLTLMTSSRHSWAQGVIRAARPSNLVDADASSVSLANYEEAARGRRTGNAGRPPLQRVSQSNRTQQAQRKPTRLIRRPVSRVEPTGYLDGPVGYGMSGTCSDCGPVCDCGVVEPGCGMEVGCGVESLVGLEPLCGMEAYGDCLMTPECGCDACDSGCTPCVETFPLFLPILRVDWNRFEFFAGTQGFKGPLNYPALDVAGQTRGGSGSFGYHQGFNEGRSLRPLWGLDLAAQFGLRATQTNPDGEEFTTENRTQIFLTGGFFRRVDYGLQYGVVVDYLNDDWFYQTDLVQLRGELSWRTGTCHEFGFHWMAATNDDLITTIVDDGAGGTVSATQGIEASNQYRAFYRRLMGKTGKWTSFIGGTDDEHVILGSTLDVPLSKTFSLQAGSTYFVAQDDAPFAENEWEGWNISLGIAFRPCGGLRMSPYARPMFDVADNGSFFVIRK